MSWVSVLSVEAWSQVIKKSSDLRPVLQPLQEFLRFQYFLRATCVVSTFCRIQTLQEQNFTTDSEFKSLFSETCLVALCPSCMACDHSWAVARERRNCEWNQKEQGSCGKVPVVLGSHLKQKTALKHNEQKWPKSIDEKDSSMDLKYLVDCSMNDTIANDHTIIQAGPRTMTASMAAWQHGWHHMAAAKWHMDILVPDLAAFCLHVISVLHLWHEGRKLWNQAPLVLPAPPVLWRHRFRPPAARHLKQPQWGCLFSCSTETCLESLQLHKLWYCLKTHKTHLPSFPCLLS